MELQSTENALPEAFRKEYTAKIDSGVHEGRDTGPQVIIWGPLLWGSHGKSPLITREVVCVVLNYTGRLSSVTVSLRCMSLPIMHLVF